MKRIILILTVAAMAVAMTLGFAGSAMAQDIPPPEELQLDLPSAEELAMEMGVYPDPNAPGCWFGPGEMHTCVPVS
jgi:hypothetical protein